MRASVVFCLIGIVPIALPVSAQSLQQAVEAAWQFAPDTALTASGQAEAAARQASAERWLAAPPSVSLAERSDRFDANTGRRTQEIELALPLWRWGQRSARRALAGAEGELAAAELAEARWLLAGEVREAVWNAALESHERDFARQRLAVVERIGREVARHVEVGDMARADWLLVKGEQLAAQAALLSAERRADVAAQRYEVLTGFKAWTLPASPVANNVATSVANEAENNAANIDAALVTSKPLVHPRLQRAAAERQRAMQVGADLNQNQNEALELSLGMERERERFGQPSSDTVRLGIKIPFGGSGWNRPAVAAVGAAQARAELQWAVIQRAIDVEQSNARAARRAAEDTLSLAEQRQQAADEHARLLRKGFALGETGLAALLRAESLLLDAEAGAAKQKLLLGQAQSRLEHSLGILP